MKRWTRSFTALSLAFLLALTGQSMAVARGAPGPAGQMVICTGTGPIMVSVDESGAPTGPAHICPEAALSLIQLAFDSPQAELLTNMTPLDYIGIAARQGQGRDVWQLQARGPPLSV